VVWLCLFKERNEGSQSQLYFVFYQLMYEAWLAGEIFMCDAWKFWYSDKERNGGNHKYAVLGSLKYDAWLAVKITTI
jgi:hypothetical protein